MQDLNDMVTFARVVEAKSFSEAARRMHASKSRVSKAIAKLERSLGARLLNRSTRGLSLTEVGAAFYEHCARIVEEAEQAEQVVSHLHAEPRGVLKVTASVAFGTLHVAPALPEFLARHPELRIDMTISDRVVDLVEEGYDLGVRITREPGLNLVARKLAPVRRVICATPGYFKRRGVPKNPADLAGHNCLHYTAFGGPSEWRLRGPQKEFAVPVAGSLRINDDEALSQAVLGGLGVALLPTFIIGKELQAGRLQAVLADYVPLEQHVYAVHLPNVHLPPKIRAFVDFLRARFGPEPYWDRPDAARARR
ncbi:MAG: LysR family transcriptional regulator [Burkholderiales bacterium]|nr:LysR family transcriptional regulator [Burkholderiales bacterium]